MAGDGGGASEPAPQWFSVRRVIEVEPELFEERITIWLARSFDEAITLSEAEVDEYTEAVGGTDLGLGQCFQMSEPLLEPAGDEDGHQVPPRLRPGAEVFSLMRKAPMDAGVYLSAFFDTGGERQRIAGS